MPELPEVETLRGYLGAALPCRSVVSVEILDKRIFATPREVVDDELAGHRVERVARRGKVVILFLQDSGSLLINAKMTGQLVVTIAGTTGSAGAHPLRVCCSRYPDRRPRHWGSTRPPFSRTTTRGGSGSAGSALAGDRLGTDDPFLRRLGSEPLTGACTVAVLREALTRPMRAPVKAVLLNQAVVAGIGNV